MTSLLVRWGRTLMITAALAGVAACGQWAQNTGVVAQAGVGVRATGQDDAVRRAILSGPETPRTIYDVRSRLAALGGKLKTHIVANRGHHNPEAGSFSFFETYAGPMTGGTVKEGELFIGFFSERQGDRLAVQQSFEPGLMIELIAWDYTKQAYNFWELVGTGKSSEWHYRGDSADVLADVAAVQPAAPSKAAFGNRLRCSGCHTLGGPIMKELDGPHNDWWTDRDKLDLGSLKLEIGADPRDAAQTAGRLFRDAEDASHLAKLVRAGTERMLAHRRPQPLRQELRSLFGTMEMNLVSDVTPFPQRAAKVALPAAFFVDARLAPGAKAIPVERGMYERALAAAGSRFAPDEAKGLSETRHAFVVPARSHVDDTVIDTLVKRGLLDAELVADVLAVDFTTPVYSAARAGLLKHVPANAANAAELRTKLIASLGKANDPAAAELLKNLTDPTRTAAFHRQRAQAYLAAAAQAARSPEAVEGWLKLASQRRVELAAAATSQNPRGQILEPGFRVIFPVDRLASRPGQWSLDPATALARR